MSISWSIYGMGVQADAAIAGLAGLPEPERVDLRLSLGSTPPGIDSIPADEWQLHFVSSRQQEDGGPTIRVCRLSQPAYFRLAYADGTVFFVDARGEAVWATWPQTATLEDTATYLLGPVLGFVLRLRGVTCLHASAVAIDGRAVALVGPSGCGKSSTAAAFARLGYPVLTDDIAALSEDGNRFKVQPAYPRVRLWPESVQALFGRAEALPRITPTWEKRFLDLRGGDHRFQPHPLPLAAVYFLEPRSDGASPRVEAIGGRAGLMSLVAHSYATRLLDNSMRRREFESLARLAAAVPMRRVTPSADFTRIAELCETIVDDAARASGAIG